MVVSVMTIVSVMLDKQSRDCGSTPHGISLPYMRGWAGYSVQVDPPPEGVFGRKTTPLQRDAVHNRHNARKTARRVFCVLEGRDFFDDNSGLYSVKIGIIVNEFGHFGGIVKNDVTPYIARSYVNPE